MQELEFEWDEYKSNQIYEKRGFDFGFAAQAFLDPGAIHEPDIRTNYGVRAASGSSQPGRPALTRFKLTPDGVLLKEAVGGGWIVTNPRVDLPRLDATTDADIHHQRIAELVDEALQASMSSLAQLAEAMHLSASTIRRWRRGAASPTAANLRRLEERLGTRP